MAETHSDERLRAKHLPPQLDEAAFERTESASPSSSAHSPLTPAIVRPSSASATSEIRIAHTSKKPATGPQRSKSTSSASKGEREKRKRSRVTPEQLVHLERFFAVDRSPTAARRKEISDMLGMQERQTQIWFQNRRAKAKLQDGKKGRGASTETPPDTPPELSTGYEAELHNLIHEDEPVTIIPCTDLSIGTWRRIATTVGKHDLVAYLCDAKRCLTWFIQSAGYGFKMETPFDIIVDTEFTNAAPGSGLATFVLSQPPTFYLESLSSSPSGQGTGPIRQWKKCADWTEGQQATKVLRHDLIGSAVQLAHVLRHLNTHTSGSDIRLHPPHVTSSIMFDHQHSTPSVTLSGPGYHYPNDMSDRPDQNRRKSFPGPVLDNPHALHGPGISLPGNGPVGMPQAPASAPYNTASFTSYPGRPPALHTPTHHPSPMFSDFSDVHTPLSSQSLPRTPLDYPHHGFPLSLSSRPYHSGDSRPGYDDGVHMLSPYPSEPPYSAGLSQASLHSPSPPLLTTPYPPSQSSTQSYGPNSAEASVVSGLPGYESRDDVHH